MLPLLPEHYYVARRWGQSRCFVAIDWSDISRGRHIARMRDVTNFVMPTTLFHSSFIERWSREVTLNLRPYNKRRNILIDFLMGRPRLQRFDSAVDAYREVCRQRQLPTMTERITERIARVTMRWMCRQPRWLSIALVVLASPFYILFAPSILVEELMESRR